MEIEIVSRKENKVLEREEIIFKIKYEGKTPSRNKVRGNLGSMVGGKVVILEYIKPVYGISEANGYARVYKSEKKAREVEAKHIIKRNLAKGGEEKEPVEKPPKKEEGKGVKEEPSKTEEKKEKKGEEAPKDKAEEDVKEEGKGDNNE